jgi:hypothetical protein
MKTTLGVHGIALIAATTLASAGCATTAATAQQDEERRVAANLANFDDLDFNAFTKQDWDRFHRTHTQDVVVHWPDGHTTKGFDKHIEDLKAMFVWAPDTRITAHPIKVGQGDWTAVVGVMEGTFTQPMPIGDGKTIPPTGKAFKIKMATFSHWNKEGVFDEEYLFWDNQEFMKQIGLGK